MIAVDTNILVQAHREELPDHRRAVAWLTHLAQGAAPWGIPVFCLGEFVRVVTHPRLFAPPSRLDQAFAALKALLQSPTVRLLAPGSRFAELLEGCAIAADARGNLAFDAQIAAVCIEHGASELLTLDRDFARFPRIRLLPLTAPFS